MKKRMRVAQRYVSERYVSERYVSQRYVSQRYVSQRYVSQRNEEEAKILYIIIKEHYLSFIVPKVAQFYFGLLFECSCFFTVHECS